MGKQIAVGMPVIDIWGHRGVVISIDIPENLTIEDHGGIEVYQIDRDNYGHTNCEHYAYYGWEKVIKFLDSPVEMPAKALEALDRIFRERDIKLFEENPYMKMPVFVGRDNPKLEVKWRGK